MAVPRRTPPSAVVAAMHYTQPNSRIFAAVDDQLTTGAAPRRQPAPNVVVLSRSRRGGLGLYRVRNAAQRTASGVNEPLDRSVYIRDYVTVT